MVTAPNSKRFVIEQPQRRMPRGKSSNPSTSSRGQSSSQMSHSLNLSQASSSSQSQSQAHKVAAIMEQSELNRKVDELVQFLLVMDQKKIPIKKADINKTVLKEHSRGLPVVMKIAADHLQKVFGIEIVELQDKLKGSYILINKMKDPTHLTWNDADNAKTGLLMVVLSIVFMSGNVVQDGELWHSLRGFGVNPDQHHETFGDVKKLVMQEFVKQAYLETTRVPNSDPSVYEVRWGQRAMHETSKKDILKFVCLLYKMEPAQWAAQYHDAMEEEETARNAAAGSV